MPAVGGRKISHLESNIKAIEHNLTDKQMAALEEIYPFEYGFPYNKFGTDSATTGKTENWLLAASAQVQWVKAEKAPRLEA